MAVFGLNKTKPFHYKKINHQVGSVLVHQGEIFLIGMGIGLISGGRPYGYPHTKAIPPCKIEETIVEALPIDYQEDQVINGRFFGWQNGGEWWLFIQPEVSFLDPDKKSDKPKPAYAVLYHKYK